MYVITMSDYNYEKIFINLLFHFYLSTKRDHRMCMDKMPSKLLVICPILCLDVTVVAYSFEFTMQSERFYCETKNNEV